MGQAYKIPYEDGSVYTGECKNAKPHGKGKLIYGNGNVFEGEFEYGYPKQGTINYTNGDRYIGEFRDQKHNGNGVFTCKEYRLEGYFE